LPPSTSSIGTALRPPLEATTSTSPAATGYELRMALRVARLALQIGRLDGVFVEHQGAPPAWGRRAQTARPEKLGHHVGMAGAEGEQEAVAQQRLGDPAGGLFDGGTLRDRHPVRAVPGRRRQRNRRQTWGRK
jgi:hypothetical protein